MSNKMLQAGLLGVLLARKEDRGTKDPAKVREYALARNLDLEGRHP